MDSHVFARARTHLRHIEKSIACFRYENWNWHPSTEDGDGDTTLSCIYIHLIVVLDAARARHCIESQLFGVVWVDGPRVVVRRTVRTNNILSTHDIPFYCLLYNAIYTCVRVWVRYERMYTIRAQMEWLNWFAFFFCLLANVRPSSKSKSESSDIDCMSHWFSIIPTHIFYPSQSPSPHFTIPF